VVWGLGVWGWPHTPQPKTPNPQSPIPNLNKYQQKIIKLNYVK